MLDELEAFSHVILYVTPSSASRESAVWMTVTEPTTVVKASMGIFFGPFVIPRNRGLALVSASFTRQESFREAFPRYSPGLLVNQRLNQYQRIFSILEDDLPAACVWMCWKRPSRWLIMILGCRQCFKTTSRRSANMKCAQMPPT